MKFTHLLAACMLLGLLMHPSFAQTLDISFFSTQKITDFGTMGSYQVTPSGKMYRITHIPANGGGNQIPKSRLIQKLNPELKAISEYEVDLQEVGKRATIAAVLCHDDLVTVLAFVYLDNENKVVFKRLLLNSDDLSVSSPFTDILSVEGVEWDFNMPNFYPVSTTISSDQATVFIGLMKKVVSNRLQPIPSVDIDGGSLSFMLSKDMEVTFRKENISTNAVLSSDRESIITGFFDVQSERSSIQSYNISTGEEKLLLSNLEYFWQGWTGANQKPYFYTFQKEGRESGVFGLYDPESMQEPVVVSFTSEEEPFFAPKKLNKLLLWTLFGQEILDIFQSEEGNWIVTTEYKSFNSTLDQVTNNGSTIYSAGHFTSFCVSPEGELLWINCIPKYQSEYAPSRLSGKTFRDAAGIHFIYNDGENNLTIDYQGKPKPFGDQGAGADIIAHGIISNKGEVTRKKLYDLEEDGMWLNVTETTRVSDGIFVLRLNYKRKEKFGFLRISD